MSITVTIPVGPFKTNVLWLDEAMNSIFAQTLRPDEVLIICDGASIPRDYYYRYSDNRTYTRVWRAPWRLGISHAFNFGVMMAVEECVFMLGSDDTLEPTCLEKCMEAYNKNWQLNAYYSVPIRYMDTQEIQTAPCNAAMTTKTFWKQTGGFPIETAIGIGDSTFLSICIKHKLPVRWIGEDTGQPDVPLYNYRRHPDIHTYKLGPWWGVVDSIRNIATEQWSEEAVKEWSGNYGS